jgi:ribosome-associated toxin RatA of RatAB toxin-antitoxin module
VRQLIPGAIVACLIVVPAIGVPTGASGDEVAKVANSTSTGVSLDPFRAAPHSKASKHKARGVTQIEINAPRDYVWKVLTNFDNYPVTFRRIKSCRVTNREGSLVFTESHLKSHWLICDTPQRAVNDLAGAPDTLTWSTIGGNFSSLEGKWELKPLGSGNRCIATYTLELDGAGAVPAPLLSFVLTSMQKEIVGSLKKTVESAYQQQRSI